MKDLSMHILDISQNSTRAGATEIIIDFIVNRSDDTLTIAIKDNGSGMDKETVEQALNPFFYNSHYKKCRIGSSFA